MCERETERERCWHIQRLNTHFKLSTDADITVLSAHNQLDISVSNSKIDFICLVGQLAFFFENEREGKFECKEKVCTEFITQKEQNGM